MSIRKLEACEVHVHVQYTRFTVIMWLSVSFLPPVQPVQFNTLQSNEFYPQDYPDNGGRGDEEPFQHLEVHLVRQVSGFGFRIIGGREEGSQVTIGGIVQGGAADVDGRLQVTTPT